MLFADYGTAAEWAVAGGTLLLALATFVLARGAKKQIGVAEQHVVAIQRPLVVPVVTEAWERLNELEPEPYVALKNVGLGPAYNVEGSLYWLGGSGGATSIQRLTVGAGESLNDARVLGEGIFINWPGVTGFLRYLDSAGTEWQTHFRYQEIQQVGMEVVVTEVGKTSDLGEPRYSAEGRAPS
jgi:hypothetical protein